MKSVLLLGASGSIGQQTLDVISSSSSDFQLVAFSVGEKVETIAMILRNHSQVKHICIKHRDYIDILKKQYPHIRFYYGDKGLIRLIKNVQCDLIVNALVGFAGFPPTIAALKKNATVCLANKESLVIGGEILNGLLSKGHGRIFPIDSEHVALAKCLSKVPEKEVDKLILTASGGAFRDYDLAELEHVTPEAALKHPTWRMGAKITIDSATMMNKGFEVIEAYYLFGFPLDKIDILMHSESHVHSIVKLHSGTYLADVSNPDMRAPIAHALHEGRNAFEITKVQNIKDFGPYHFGDFDQKRYPCVGLAKEALAKGGTALAVLNAANETCVYAFLENKIAFLDIPRLISACLAKSKSRKQTFRNVIQADKITRLQARKMIGKQHGSA